MRYMIWNNKGGVGKTLITYLLATRYAELHPKKQVIVADMCPQSNVSEMILGGNGRGESNLEKLYQLQITIAGYIKERYNSGKRVKIGSETNYFVKVRKYNPRMPDNLYLLPGDIDLDICSTIISFLERAPERNAWKNSRSFLGDLLDGFEASAKMQNREAVIFIDCNPSFSNYTEMVVMASERIIVPCTADSASLRGIGNLFRLIYGTNLDENKSASVESVFNTFAEQMREQKIAAPKLHLLIQNKSRSRDADATAAFKAHINEIEQMVRGIKTRHAEHFTQNRSLVLNLKDGNTLASVLNHTGLPLSQVEHKRYTIYGKSTQVNQSQLDPFIDDLNQCVKLL